MDKDPISCISRAVEMVTRTVLYICVIMAPIFPNCCSQRLQIGHVLDMGGRRINRDVPATNYLCNKGDHKYKADYSFHELRCHGFGIEGEELSVMKELSICPFENLFERAKGGVSR